MGYPLRWAIVVAAFVAKSPLSPVDNPHISTDLDGYAGTDWPPGDPHVLPVALMPARAAALPVAAYPVARTAMQTGAWSYDYYYRIHMYPLTIDAGNVGSDRQFQLTMWNADFVAHTISAINMSQAGVIVTPPSSLPLTVKPLQEITLTVTVSSEGSSVIDSDITFTFSPAIATLPVNVSGLRGALWPFAPRSELIEAVEWRTDVVPAYDGEFRVSLRDEPLREFSMSHVGTPYGQQAARSAMRFGGAVLLPEWPRQYIGAAHTGAAVPFPDGPALIWVSESEYEQVEVTGGVLGPVVYPKASARILPLLRCRTNGGWANSRPAGKYSQMTLSLQTGDDPYAPASGRYSDYLGYPVVLDAKCIGAGAADEGTAWEYDTADNGIGLPEDFKAALRPEEKFTARWVAKADDYLSLRAWIYSRRGRYLPFWLPSWADDMGEASIVASTLTVERYSERETHVLMQSGSTWTPAEVTASVVVPGGVELTVSNAPLTVDRVMYLRLVRFAADRVEFRHAAAEPVAVAIQCVRVSE